MPDDGEPGHYECDHIGVDSAPPGQVLELERASPGRNVPSRTHGHRCERTRKDRPNPAQIRTRHPAGKREPHGAPPTVSGCLPVQNSLTGSTPTSRAVVHLSIYTKLHYAAVTASGVARVGVGPGGPRNGLSRARVCGSGGGMKPECPWTAGWYRPRPPGPSSTRCPATP